MLKKMVGWYFKALELLMVLSLAAMSVMVFGNVVLRHFFNSGVNTAEELSRFMFIWLTFLGAIVAMREGGHLGVDMLIRKLSGASRFAAVLLGQLLVVLCCLVLLWGLWQQRQLHMANTGLVTGIPMIVVYCAAYLCALSIGVLSLRNVLGLLSGKLVVDDLITSSHID